MKITKIIALAVIVASSSVAMTQAQSLLNADPPAEFPPSSYKSTQYVDSRGCVYVRAGISGDMTWIPRVTRSRKQLCGQTPSIAGAVASAQPRAKAADKPIQITLDAPVNVAPTAKTVAKAKVAAAPKPRRVSVAGPAAARKPVTIAASPVVIRPVPSPKLFRYSHKHHMVYQRVQAHRQPANDIWEKQLAVWP